MKFFHRLFKRSSTFVAPQTVHKAPTYMEGYVQALRFTRSLGFTTTALELSDTTTDVLDPDGDFVNRVFDSAQIKDRMQAAGQCIKWCHYLQPYFQRQLGRRVMLTSGQLWNKNACVFGPQFQHFERWLKHGFQADDFEDGNGIKLHAWLTVETGEIIEPTFLSSLAAFGHPAYRKFAGATVWGRDPHVLNGHRYVPLAVGSELIEKIAGRSFAPILARRPSELALHAHPVLTKR